MSIIHFLAASQNPVTAVTEEFGVNGQLLFSQLLAFIVVAFFLTKFAYKPLLKALEDRRQRIEEGLKNADKIKQELAEAEAARKEIMEKPNAQANKLIEEARADFIVEVFGRQRRRALLQSL